MIPRVDGRLETAYLDTNSQSDTLQPGYGPGSGTVYYSNVKIEEMNYRAASFKAQLLGLKKEPVNPSAINPQTFIDDKGANLISQTQISPVSIDAKPEQAAAFLSYSLGVQGPAAKNSLFVEALKIHYNDPKWNQDFFKALGTERSAELINNVVNTGNYIGSTDAAAHDTSIVRLALTSIAKSGNLTQADMDNLVRNLSKDGLNSYVLTEVFAKLPNENLKNSFVNSALKLGGDALNAAAVHVLARTSPSNQATVLDPLRQTGKLEPFLQSADKGSHRIATFNSLVKQYGSLGPPPEFEIYGDTNKLSLDVGNQPLPPNDEPITTLPFDPNEGIPAWRDDDLQGRAQGLWLKYEQDGKVDFKDFGQMLNDIAGMPDLAEREKASLWTTIAHSKDQHQISLDGLRKENIDSYFSGQSDSHIVIGFDDGYHCPLAMLTPEEANKKITEHENFSGNFFKKWSSKIVFGGPNEGDIKASQNQVESLRAYREGGFKSYAEAWNRLYLE